MSDFLKYIGEQYDADQLKTTFKEIKENVSQQENQILPSMCSMHDDLINEFTNIFQGRCKLNEKFFELERELDSTNTTVNLVMEQLSVAQDVARVNKETVANLNEVVNIEETNIHNLMKQHYTFMMKLAGKFRNCYIPYDKEALKAEIKSLDEEVQRQMEIKENRKVEMDELREELERAKENIDLDNLKTALDGLGNLKFMKTYLVQTQQALDDKILKTKQAQGITE